MEDKVIVSVQLYNKSNFNNTFCSLFTPNDYKQFFNIEVHYLDGTYKARYKNYYIEDGNVQFGSTKKDIYIRIPSKYGAIRYKIIDKTECGNYISIECRNYKFKQEQSPLYIYENYTNDEIKNQIKNNFSLYGQYNQTVFYDGIYYDYIDKEIELPYGTSIGTWNVRGVSKENKTIDVVIYGDESGGEDFTYNENDEEFNFEFSSVITTQVIGFSVTPSTSYQYSVGSKFLNNDDDSTITLYTETTSVTLPLRDYPEDIIICNYKKGQVFNEVENIEANFQLIQGQHTSYTYKFKVDYYEYLKSHTHKIVAINIENEDLTNVYYRNRFKLKDMVGDSKYLLVEEYYDNVVSNTCINENGVRVRASDKEWDTIEIYGIITNIYNYDDVEDNQTLEQGKIVLFSDYMPIQEGANNLTIKFPVYEPKQASYINKCKFGILFGNNNAKNRLFVSGNEDYPNIDWHSGAGDVEYIEDNTFQSGNLGYFPDTSYCAYGETDNDIVGYDIVSNDKLLVLKNKSDKETTIYFRTPTLVVAKNSSGEQLTNIDGNYLYQEEFSLVRGNSSVAAISQQGIANLNGDSLFISSDKNVVGLDLEGIVGDSQRYANTRSYYIDRALNEEINEDSMLWTNNKELWLITNDKVYMTNYETKSSETKQYEWFPTNIKNVTSVLELGNKKYLGTSDGKLLQTTDDYEDTFIYQYAGNVVFNNDNEVVINDNIIEFLNDSDKSFIEFVPTDEEYPSYCIADSTNATFDSNGYMYLNETDIEIENLLESHTQFYGKYNDDSMEQITILPTDLNNLGKKIYQIVGSVNGLNSIYLDLNEEYPITNIDIENKTIEISINGNPLSLYELNYEESVHATFKKKTNVRAYYVTKPFLNNLNYFKTIWSWTVTNDTNIPSDLKIGYVSNKIPYSQDEEEIIIKEMATISKAKLGISLGDLFIKAIDFDKNITPRTYTSNRILSQLKYVCFGFKSYENANSVLSSISIVYTLPYPSYGGD